MKISLLGILLSLWNTITSLYVHIHLNITTQQHPTACITPSNSTNMPTARQHSSLTTVYKLSSSPTTHNNTTQLIVVVRFPNCLKRFKAAVTFILLRKITQLLSWRLTELFISFWWMNMRRKILTVCIEASYYASPFVQLVKRGAWFLRPPLYSCKASILVESEYQASGAPNTTKLENCSLSLNFSELNEWRA